MKFLQTRLIACLIIIISLQNAAQVTPRALTMLSPTAAQLSEFGEVPVSPFTGVPQIEIPIYTINEGPHEFPLKLSYHSGGVRPDQYPGWTGVGWSLMAGGCISRVVQGMPDEYDNSLQNYISESGYYYRHNTLNTPNWNNAQYIADNLLENTTDFYDTEPDVFSFNFLDYHGKFFLSDTGQWLVQCDKDVKIEFHGNDAANNFIDPFEGMSHTNFPESQGYDIGYSHAFKRFDIIGEDGTRYIFGGSNTAIEYSVNFVVQSRCDYTATSWFLTRIEYADGRNIQLDYEEHNENGNTTFEAQLGINYNKVTNMSMSLQGADWYDDVFINLIDTIDIYNGMLIKPCYLSSITASNVQITFNRERSMSMEYDLDRYIKPSWLHHVYYNTPSRPIGNFMPMLYENSVERDVKHGVEPRPEYYKDPFVYSALQRFLLTNISIKSNYGSIIRFIGLDYGYDTDYNRAYLETVDFYGTDNNREGRYSMEYYERNQLPPLLADKTDHWGYYNGRKANAANYAGYYNYKQPADNPECYLYGTLCKLTYPTGGYAKFEFGRHDYSRHINSLRTGFYDLLQDSIAGGLRINRINLISSQGEDSVCVTYKYLRDYEPGGNNNSKRSSGVLGTNSIYYIQGYTPNQAYAGMSVSINSFSTQSVCPGNENSCGCHIGYSLVAEERSNGSCTIHRFSNFDNGDYADQLSDLISQPAHRMCEQYTSRAFLRGLPLSIEKYAIDSNTGISSPVEKIEIAYSPDDGNGTSYAKALKKHGITRIRILDRLFNTYYYYYYEINAYRHYCYLPRKVSESVTRYANSGQDSIRTTTTYAYADNKLPCKISHNISDGSVLIDSINYVCHSTYVNRHINSLVGSTYRYKGNNLLSSKMLQYNGYDLAPTAVWTGKGGSPNVLEVEYKVDSLQNVVEEKHNGVFSTSYVWGYRGNNIVAVVRGATIEQVETVIGSRNAFIHSVAPNYYLLNSLRNSLPEAEVSVYHWIDPIGVSVSTGPDGIKIRYGYDSFGRLNSIADHDYNITDGFFYRYNNQ